MDLKTLKELEATATPGPWTNGEVWCDQNSDSDSTTGWKAYGADAKFITAYRNLAPHFIAHMEAAKELGIKFNACQATYTPEGDETDATAEASESIHEAFLKMAEAQNAFAAAIRAL